MAGDKIRVWLRDQPLEAAAKSAEIAKIAETVEAKAEGASAAVAAVAVVGALFDRWQALAKLAGLIVGAIGVGAATRRRQGQAGAGHTA